jgi:Mor family transcriptional regulator
MAVVVVVKKKGGKICFLSKQSKERKSEREKKFYEAFNLWQVCVPPQRPLRELIRESKESF